jgi:hypothetical protein
MGSIQPREDNREVTWKEKWWLRSRKPRLTVVGSVALTMLHPQSSALRRSLYFVCGLKTTEFVRYKANLASWLTFGVLDILLCRHRLPNNQSSYQAIRCCNEPIRRDLCLLRQRVEACYRHYSSLSYHNGHASSTYRSVMSGGLEKRGAQISFLETP